MINAVIGFYIVNFPFLDGDSPRATHSLLEWLVMLLVMLLTLKKPSRGPNNCIF